MQDRVTLVDFNDSFTYNIASTLYEMGIACRVLSYDQIDAIDCGRQKQIILLGPGPGRPCDYPKALSFINAIRKQENIFILGICLGHQLYWYSRGFAIKRSSHPVHGQSHLLSIPKWPIFKCSDWGRCFIVQRYNSLVLDVASIDSRFHFEGGECQMGRDERVLTYQFHPESVGTSYPRFFFKPLIDFLYNG